jgi:hypothetical protein
VIRVGVRLGLAASVFCLVLGVLRWAPVYAQPPWPVRAAPSGAAVIVFAVLSALTSTSRSPRRRVRGWLAGLALAGLFLSLLVRTHATAGLRAHPSGLAGDLPARPPGPIDLVGHDLDDAPRSRKWRIEWKGHLLVPERGLYRLWADGHGEVAVTIDGHPLLLASGEHFREGEDVPFLAGDHRIEVVLERVGPGPRLRLGWIRPSGYSETIPPRLLYEDGAPAPSPWTWRLVDALALLIAGLAALLAIFIPWDRARPTEALAPPVTRGEMIGSAFGHLAILIVMSWPLVLDLAGQGMVDRPDGRLNAWILSWDVHAIRHGRSPWDAPIFHPLPDALAFSENLLLPAIVTAPAQIGGPVFAYNLALLLSLLGSGLAVQLLVRRVSDDRFAAFAAGVFFAAGAHRWIRLAHLQSQVTVFLPLALLAFDRWLERRTLRRALLVGLMLALQGLSSVYVGAITAMAVSVAAALAWFRLSWGERARLVAGLAFAAVLLLPVARAYLRMRDFQGMEWTIADVRSYATNLTSYASSGTRLYGWITQRHLDPESVRDNLFPGLVLLAAGIAGLGSAPRRFRTLAITASIVAIVFSLGPETAAYRWLHEHVVFVRGVRALARFSLIPVLCLSVLGGLALAGRRRLAIVALVLFLLESSNVPIRYAPYAGPSAAARWLAQGAGALVHVPLGEDDTQAMLDGLFHGRPLVNGDSGFIPRPYARAMELLQGEVGEDPQRFLRAVGVTHVIAREGQPLVKVATFDGEAAYELPDGQAAHVVVAAPARSTTWDDRTIVVDLGEPMRVERVTFEPDDRPWVDAPVLAASSDGRSWASSTAHASLADATLSLVRDPRHGLAEIRFAPVTARYLRLPADVPVRAGAIGAE